MAGSLIEANLLSGRELAQVGPVAGHVKNTHKQVGQPIVVPIDGRHLDDPRVRNAQVHTQPQREPAAEDRFLRGTLVGHAY